MAQKIIKTINDNKNITDSVDNSLNIDKNEILRLMKIVNPSSGDMGSIFELYKKYINPRAMNYTISGCQTCGNNIANYWRQLGQWYNSNKDMFKQK